MKTKFSQAPFIEFIEDSKENGDVDRMFCSCSGRACGERWEPVDTKDRNCHYPVLPGESDQRAVGGAVWSGVTKKSLSFHHGKVRQKVSPENDVCDAGKTHAMTT